MTASSELGLLRAVFNCIVCKNLASCSLVCSFVTVIAASADRTPLPSRTHALQWKYWPVLKCPMVHAQSPFRRSFCDLAGQSWISGVDAPLTGAFFLFFSAYPADVHISHDGRSDPDHLSGSTFWNELCVRSVRADRPLSLCAPDLCQNWPSKSRL